MFQSPLRIRISNSSGENLTSPMNTRMNTLSGENLSKLLSPKSPIHTRHNGLSRENLFHQASPMAAREQKLCWCGEIVTNEPGHLRLGCGCLVHNDCLIDFVKSWSGDINRIQEWGVVCPYGEDCRRKQDLGRSYYISPLDLDDLLRYQNSNTGESSPLSKHLDDHEIERFKRLSQEKRHRLACGCFVKYEVLLRHVRHALNDTKNFHNARGIECPFVATGACEGPLGCFLSLDDINRLADYGRDLSRRRLFPLFSPKSEPGCLTECDIEVFQSNFHNHVCLGCHCFVHFDTLVNHLYTWLKQESCGAVVCPNSTLCRAYGLREMEYRLTEVDIEAIREHERETTLLRRSDDAHCVGLCLTADEEDSFDHRKPPPDFSHTICSLTEKEWSRLMNGCARDSWDGDARNAKRRLFSSTNDSDSDSDCSSDDDDTRGGKGEGEGEGGVGEMLSLGKHQCKGRQQDEGDHGQGLAGGSEGAFGGGAAGGTEATAPISAKADHAAFLALRDATSKACPSCGYPQTHYHGHHCHHVREGCYRCGAHFCYSCLSSATENSTHRGEAHVCKCGGWSNFCNVDELLENLVVSPYPHDSRCGCPVCPECRPGKPCQGCDGTCVVCKDMIMPGPPGLTSEWTAQSAVQRARYEEEVRYRCLVSCCCNGDLDSLRGLLSDDSEWIASAGVGAGEGLSERLRVDWVDATGVTLLHWASMSGHVDIIYYLLDRYSQTHTTTQAGERTPEMANSDGAADELLQGMDCVWPHAPPAFSADVRSGRAGAGAGAGAGTDLAVDRTSTADELMSPEVTCFIDRQDISGTTALHYACQEGHVQAALVLLDKGATADVVDVDGNTALLRAATRRHLSCVLLLAQRGGDIEHRDAIGECALLSACLNGHVELVTALLDKGAAATTSDGEGRSALVRACYLGFVDVVEVLLLKGGLRDVVDEPDQHGDTAMSMAVQGGQAKVVELLIDMGANINAVGAEGRCALRIASYCGSLDVVEVLVRRGAHVNAQDDLGNFALKIASYYGFLEIVELLLDNDADSALQDKNGDSALRSAVLKGHANVVQLLLVRGADPDLADIKGDSPLRIASFCGFLEIAKLLLDHDANQNMLDHKRWTSVITASCKGNSKVVELLLAHGADPNLQDLKEDFALRMAALNGFQRIVDSLLNHGANPNLCDQEGWTPLITASYKGHLSIVVALLGASATANARDVHGQTALMVASEEGHIEVAEVLLNGGAEVNLIDNQGVSALALACKGGHESMIELLLQRGACADVRGFGPQQQLRETRTGRRDCWISPTWVKYLVITLKVLYCAVLICSIVGSVLLCPAWINASDRPWQTIICFGVLATAASAFTGMQLADLCVDMDNGNTKQKLKCE